MYLSELLTNFRTKDGKVKVGDVLKKQIFIHFKELILEYIIGGTIYFFSILIFLISSILVIWRAQRNIDRSKIVIQKIKINYKGKII